MKRRYLTVPKNNIGFEEYDSGIEQSENLFTTELPENEYILLIDLFELLNREFGLLIDDYESEIIPVECFEICLDFVKKTSGKTPEFFRALSLAMDKKTMIALDF